MPEWKKYRNGQGARREDGLYVRPAWNWFPEGLAEPKYHRGWDVLKGMVICGTYPLQPLDGVLQKVDGAFPLGLKYHQYRPLYTVYDCSGCLRVSFLTRGIFSRVQVTCGHCGATRQVYAHDIPVREFELLPNQKLSEWVDLWDRSTESAP